MIPHIKPPADTLVHFRLSETIFKSLKGGMTSASQKDIDSPPHRGSLVTAESLKLLNPNDHHDNSIRQNWVGHLSQSPLGPGSLPLASQQLPEGNSTSLPFLPIPEQ